MEDERQRDVGGISWELCEEAATAVLVVGPGGRIALVNRGAERLFRYDRSELLGQKVEVLLPPSLREGHERMRREYGAAPRARRMGIGLELSGQRKDGSIFSAEIGLNPIMAGGGLHILCVIAETTERLRLERERLHGQVQSDEASKERSLGAMAGGVAHDFNNLMMCILGHVEMMRLEAPADSPMAGYLDEIRDATKRGSEITERMLAFSGKLHLTPEPVDLTRVIEGMEASLQAMVPARVALNLDLSPDLPVIRGDSAALRQVLGQLVTNALEAIGERVGSLSISTQLVMADAHYLAQFYRGHNMQDGPAVCLDVADNGCGMEPETRGRLFEPFFSTKMVGRGLGLPAVLGIVRGHGGAIHVYSEPGQGTRVRILFPLARAPAPPPASLSVEPPAGSVLVVEDEPHLRALTCRVLDSAGYRSVDVACGADALRVVAHHGAALHAVLLDFNTPGLRGEDVLQQLRGLRADLPVVVLSGFPAPLDAPILRDDPLVVYVEKPSTSDELLDALARVACGR